MEIVLTVAIAVVAAAGLYVAATFSKRTRQTTAPLLEAAVSDISAQMRATADDLRRQLQAITDDLHHDREQQKLDGRKILGRLDHADSRISNMANQVLAELDAIKRRGEQIGTRQDQLSGDLQQLATRRTGDPGPLG
jgi:methylthioribose-1-phosphate isomerase